MAHDTPHTRVDLSPEIKIHKTADDVYDDKGEISIWSHLPEDEREADAEPKHVSICLDSCYGHSTRFVELSVDQARALARALNKHADEVEAYEPEWAAA